MLRVDTIVEAAKLLDVNPSVLLGETELEIEEGIENVVSE
jgi:hypothetical protein